MSTYTVHIERAKNGQGIDFPPNAIWCSIVVDEEDIRWATITYLNPTDDEPPVSVPTTEGETPA